MHVKVDLPCIGLGQELPLGVGLERQGTVSVETRYSVS